MIHGVCTPRATLTTPQRLTALRQEADASVERAEKAGTATEGDSTASTGVAIGDETSTVPMVEWDMATIESLLLVSGIGSQGIGVNSS